MVAVSLKNIIPAVFHTLLLTLCSARPERLTTSLFQVGQSSGLFLCRFHVVEGTTVNQAQSLFWRLGRSHHQQPFDRSSSPTGPIKPWVDYSRENFCCLHHNLPLGVHQHVAIKLFSAAVAGEVLIITIIIILKYSPVNQAPAPTILASPS